MLPGAARRGGAAALLLLLRTNGPGPAAVVVQVSLRGRLRGRGFEARSVPPQRVTERNRRAERVRTSGARGCCRSRVLLCLLLLLLFLLFQFKASAGSASRPRGSFCSAVLSPFRAQCRSAAFDPVGNEFISKERSCGGTAARGAGGSVLTGVLEPRGCGL